MDNKTDLRLYAKGIRKNLPLNEISKKAAGLVRESEIYKKSKHVMLYYPMTNEINLLTLLDDDKKFYLPRVNGKDIEVCPYKSGEELRESNFGVMEPVCALIDKDTLDLVIVPALIADSQNYRLGYGGGFYDRFICEKFKTLVVLPKELYIEHLPTEDFDKKVDCVIWV